MAQPPRLLPTPDITMTMSPTETRDVAFFELSVYTPGIGANVSIIEWPPSLGS